MSNANKYPLKYDDASWHFEYFEQRKNSTKNAYIHIAHLLNWAIIRNLLSEEYIKSLPKEAQKCLNDVKQRKVTAQAFLERYMDGCLLSKDFTKKANDFLSAYYEQFYLDDINGYFTSNAWYIYDKQAKMLDERFAEWEKTGSFKKKQPKQDDFSTLKKLFSGIGLNIGNKSKK